MVDQFICLAENSGGCFQSDGNLLGFEAKATGFVAQAIIDVHIHVIARVGLRQGWRHQEQLIGVGWWLLDTTMGSFADTPACGAIRARFLHVVAVSTWLAAIALFARSPARIARCMCSLTRLGGLMNMSLPEVAIEYVTSGK
jgi:hypothetical protein